MISDAQYREWLKDDEGTAIRCVLIKTTAKFGGTDQTLYLSNLGYRTGAGDTPANTQYLDVVSGGVKTSEKVSIEGKVTMSWGTIEFDNSDGALDDWLDAVWKNNDIQVLYGDYTWPVADFRLAFTGINGEIDAKDRDRLQLPVEDKLRKLTTALTEAKLGGTSANKDRLRPVLVGEAHNFEPLLINEADHEYQWHIGLGERVIEVRDDGVPITVTTTLGTGTLMLDGSPEGQITMSAQGDATGGYSNTLVGVVKKLVKNYGKADRRFTDADLDLVQLANFDASHQQAVGEYFPDGPKVIDACQKIASSIGAQVTMSRAGLLQLLQITYPLGTPTVNITVDDMVEGSFRPVGKSEVKAAVTLKFCRNYTPQDQLDSGVVEAHRDMFKKEWLTVTRTNGTVATDHKLDTVLDESDHEESSLLVENDANNEADRRLLNRSTAHMTYQFEGHAQCLTLERGTIVNLTHPRFNLSAGKTAVVVGLDPDWLNSRCIVQVMV
jgi:hypothetical protein